MVADMQNRHGRSPHATVVPIAPLPASPTLSVRRLIVSAVPLLAPATAAAATGELAHGGASVATFVAELVALLLVGRLLGELMQRIGQPAVMGQLLAGILLGPSVLGALLPDVQRALFPPLPEQKAMLDGVAQLGVLMLLLITGMEMDFSRVKAAKRAALAASVCGILVPFVCGLTLGELLPAAVIPDEHRRGMTALFLGIALAISSVKIVASVIRDLNFLRRNVGQVIVAAAIIDDTLGWILLSMILAFAQHGTLDLATLAKTAASTALFLLVSFTLGRRFVYFLIRWSNDHLASEMPVITTVLVIMGAAALTTQALGVQTVLGAFVAGMLIGQSPILTRHIEEQLRGMIVALFMPVFFGLAGLGADLRTLTQVSLLGITLAFILIASFGKFAGAFAGGALGGLTRAESLALACGMNARGSTEVIVATIGLAVGALDTRLYTMIVAMAVVTTMCMPPMLRWAVARIPVDAEEHGRLERAEFEERGFVARLERILLAADSSASGRLASYLVGLLAAPRGMPVTALTRPERAERARGLDERAVRDAMERAAKHSAATAESDGEPSRDIDLIARQHGASTEQAVAAEASKGYDILVVGLEPLLESGTTDPQVARVLDGFERAVCIVHAHRDTGEPLVRRRHRILLPVLGSSYSRDTADLALALAQAAGAPVTALYVASPTERDSWRRRLRRSWSVESQSESILQNVLDLSHHYAVQVRTSIGRSASVVDAILAELRARAYDLIVMPLAPRPGNGVGLGSISTAVLDRVPCSLVLLAN
jgi:Kef-type K+ transport system membrane component KefB/nucleotide-binding universal stress UspA family protein